jgi:hypothetical protein
LTSPIKRYKLTSRSALVSIMARPADIDRVREVLRQAVPGWVDLPASDGGAAIAGLASGLRANVAVMALSAGRIEDVLGRLALGVVMAGRAGAASRDVPVTAIVLPRLGRRIVAEAEQFMAGHGGDLGWVLADRGGDARVVIPRLGVDATLRPERARAGEPRLASTPFSDLGRWMLKILLLRDAPTDLWDGPRELPLNPTALARVAGVSVPLAHRLVATLEAQDFLRRRRDGLHLVRRDALLSLMRQDEQAAHRRPVFVRRLGGGDIDLRVVASAGGGSGLVVAGFEACRRLGVMHVFGERPIEAHALGPIDALIEKLELERCVPLAASLHLLPARHPESIRRGALARDGVLVVDGLQAALDVLHHPSRGQEQADYLFERLFSRQEAS